MSTNRPGYMRKRKADLIANGLCQRCGKNPAASGTTFCAECKIKKRKETAKYRKKKRKAGLCAYCKNPRLKGKPYCLECKVKNRITLRLSLRKKYGWKPWQPGSRGRGPIEN